MDIHGFHGFSRYFIVFIVFIFLSLPSSTMHFFAEPSGPMFLRIIDHCRQLFPMVANHRSSEAMFAMYRSSLHTSGVGKTFCNQLLP